VSGGGSTGKGGTTSTGCESCWTDKFGSMAVNTCELEGPTGIRSTSLLFENGVPASFDGKPCGPPVLQYDVYYASTDPDCEMYVECGDCDVEISFISEGYYARAGCASGEDGRCPGTSGETFVPGPECETPGVGGFGGAPATPAVQCGPLPNVANCDACNAYPKMVCTSDFIHFDTCVIPCQSDSDCCGGQYKCRAPEWTMAGIDKVCSSKLGK
jgi:hypothetical protein